MNFNSAARRWEVEACPVSPDLFIRSLLEAAVHRLPDESLGHAKGYVEFDGGAVFASSTLIPPDIQIRRQGDYHGGKMDINLVLIFADLKRDILIEAITLAGAAVAERWSCELTLL
jgi:hypothetical protein